MNPSHPDEGPEHRTDTLSPLSPKPVHFPVPSNIPLLQHQMDPGLGDAALVDGNHETNAPATLPPTNTHIQDPDALSIAQPDGATQDLNETANVASNQHELGAESVTEADIPTTTHLDPNIADLLTPIQPQSAQPTTLANAVAISNPSDLEENISGPANAESFAQLATTHGFQENASHLQTGDQDVRMGEEAPLEAPGETNIQALLENISAANLMSPGSVQEIQPFATSLASSGVLPSPSAQVMDASVMSNASDSLPARPPALQTADAEVQAPSIISPVPTQDPIVSSNALATPTAVLPAPGQLQAPYYTAGAPGTSNGPMNGLPPPPTATFQQDVQNPMQLTDPQSPIDVSRPLKKETDDVPWGPEIQKIYDGFLDDERKYVMEGNWDRFPSSSRLFIGNLPTEKVTKRDLFHVFHKHGKLAQISIKQAYGFVQFLTSESCLDALQKEQGVSIRGRKVHLEVSKPQKNTRNQKRDNNRERRSRSPERTQAQRADRYRGNGNNSRNNNNRNDAWRPNRSPSPRGRDRDRRSPNYYDGRRRSRSQDRARFGDQGAMGDDDDSLPLPRRHPSQVPDVQVIARDDPDKNFLTYIEKQFEARGVRCNVLMLSPRLNESAVMRRQIIEGVQAVMKVNRMTQMAQKFALSVFDRSGGSNNVRFEEYTDLDLRICVELVLRAKQTHRPPPSDYATSQYGLPMTPGGAMQVPPPPIPSSHLSPHGPPGGQMTFPTQASPQGMDSASLQQLLGSLGQQQPPSNRLPYANQQQQGQSAADLSRLLGSVGQQGAPSFQNPQMQQQFQNLASNPAFAGLFGSQPSQSGGGSTNVQQNHPSQHQQQSNPSQPPDMQNIMAQLARYGR